MHSFSLARFIALVVVCLACLAYAAPAVVPKEPLITSKVRGKPPHLRHTDKFGRWNIDLYTQVADNGTITHIINARYRRNLSKASKTSWDTQVGCMFTFPNPNDRTVRVGRCSDDTFQYTLRDRGLAVAQTVEHAKKGGVRVAGYWLTLHPRAHDGNVEILGFHGHEKKVVLSRAKHMVLNGWAHRVKSNDHELAFHELPSGINGEPAIGNGAL